MDFQWGFKKEFTGQQRDNQGTTMGQPTGQPGHGMDTGPDHFLSTGALATQAARDNNGTTTGQPRDNLRDNPGTEWTPVRDHFLSAGP